MAQLPRWSSDPNFSAGSQPWNGQPTRVEPPSTIKARGFLPGTVPPAGWFNWLLGVLFDERNDQDTRLTAAEARTLQDSYDASVAAGETLPTIQIGSAPITIRGPLLGGEAVVFQARGTSPAVIMQPGSAGEETLRVQNAGAILLQEEGSNNGFSVRAPDVMSGGHGITTPPAPNTASKAALVRAPGADRQATEWMPMDWGDTDGGGSGWALGLAGIGLTGTPTGAGRWERTGDVVTFSASGRLVASTSAAGMRISLPVPSNLAVASDLSASCNVISYTGTPEAEIPVSALPAWCEGEAGSDKMRIRLVNLEGSDLDCHWSVSGNYRVK